jgi:hypothetical protein
VVSQSPNPKLAVDAVIWTNPVRVSSRPLTARACRGDASAAAQRERGSYEGIC